MPQLFRLSVQSLYPGAGEPQTCEGPEVDICRWVYKNFPQVKHGHFRDLAELLEFLNQSVQGHEFELNALPQELQKGESAGWLPAFRHQRTQEVRPCHEGYHDLNVLPDGTVGDQGWDSGFVSPQGQFHSREETRAKLGLMSTNSGALWAQQKLGKAADDHPMRKVQLNPEESALRMKMHTPFFPQVYDRVHSYRTPEGFYHHVYDQQLAPDFLSQMHILSLHPSPLMETGMMASAVTDRKQRFYDQDIEAGTLRRENATWGGSGGFVNNPWGDNQFLHMGEVVSQLPHRGWGSLLYRAMGRLGRRLVSDSSVSAGAGSVWKKLITDPEFRGELGHHDDQGMTRHWAEHRGQPPQPYLEFSPKARADARPLPRVHREPWENQHMSQLQREYEHLNAAHVHDFQQKVTTQHLGADRRPESSHPVPMEEVGILPPGLQEAGNLQKSESQKSSPQELVADMLGFRPWDSDCFRAARTLAGGQDPGLQAIRSALWDHPGDDLSQALKAFGLPTTDKNRKVLQQVMRMQVGKALKKNEAQVPRELNHIRAMDDDGQELEQALRDAIDGRKVEVVDLGGRHSQGTLLVDTREEGQWLLKPGHGQSPSAGAEEDPSSQSQREAGFWHVARRWGMDEDIPRTELMNVDGHQYAAIEMLDAQWKNLGRVDVGDHGRVVQALERYRPGGQLHRWAVLDYVAGNPDRHAQNLMIGPQGQVKLIDHGTAFAGAGFDPAGDQKSFIPFYLRYQADPRTWTVSSPAAKMKRMPVIPSEEVRQGLSQWILALDPMVLQHQLQHFGIDPQASLRRLQIIQSLVRADVQQPDRVLNRLWATT